MMRGPIATEEGIGNIDELALAARTAKAIVEVPVDEMFKN